MRLLALGCTLWPALAPAAGGQIDAAVSRYLMQQLEQEAADMGWQGVRASHDTLLPSSAEPARCAAPLEIAPRGRPQPLAPRQRLVVTCPGAQGWTLTVTAQVSATLPAVHARGVLERGQIIGAGDLRMDKVDLATARRGVFTRTEEVVGMAATRRVRPGQTLTPSLLALPPAVRRGQQVRIVATHDGIEATTVGKALGEAQVGETVRVRNVSSDKVINARVVEPGVVTSTF